MNAILPPPPDSETKRALRERARGLIDHEGIRTIQAPNTNQADVIDLFTRVKQ